MGQESYKHKTHKKYVKLKLLVEGFYAVSAHILELYCFFFVAISLRANKLLTHINLNPSASFPSFPALQSQSLSSCQPLVHISCVAAPCCCSCSEHKLYSLNKENLVGLEWRMLKKMLTLSWHCHAAYCPVCLITYFSAALNLTVLSWMPCCILSITII